MYLIKIQLIMWPGNLIKMLMPQQDRNVQLRVFYLHMRIG